MDNIQRKQIIENAKTFFRNEIVQSHIDGVFPPVVVTPS
jgi:hypothetical protein